MDKRCTDFQGKFAVSKEKVTKRIVYQVKNNKKRDLKIVPNVRDIHPQYSGYSSTMFWLYILNIGDIFLMMFYKYLNIDFQKFTTYNRTFTDKYKSIIQERGQL